MVQRILTSGKLGKVFSSDTESGKKALGAKRHARQGGAGADKDKAERKYGSKGITCPLCIIINTKLSFSLFKMISRG
jgi:hypothetical protein